MIKLNKNLLLAVVAVILLGGGYWAWQQSHPAVSADEAVKPAAHKASDTLHFEANAPQLTFLQIKPVESFPEPLVEALNARIAYDDNHTARVYSPVNGRVIKISGEVGQTVKSGDILLQIDAPDYAAAASDKVKADADLVHKQQSYDRAKQLYEAQGIARRDLEAAEADWHQAEAEALRAKARLNNFAGKSTDGQFQLRAPLSGIITERQVNAGSEVRPDAATPLFTITDPQHLWVLIDLPEQQLAKVKVGQPVFIEVDAYPDEIFYGRVTVIAGALDPLTRRIQVRCYLNNPEHKLKPEMYARVTPDLDSEKHLPRIPNTALFTQGVASFVFVEISPGVLQRRKVELALQDHEYSYVKQGLQAGERLVTSGALLLNSELSGEN
jgi:cobalt-zinc-cadmium efflux system membrane fusion protein